MPPIRVIDARPLQLFASADDVACLARCVVANIFRGCRLPASRHMARDGMPRGIRPQDPPTKIPATLPRATTSIASAAVTADAARTDRYRRATSALAHGGRAPAAGTPAGP